MKKVLVTGAAGFIGKNLCVQLGLREDVELLAFTREQSLDDLTRQIEQADFIFHIAGVNRPKNPADFVTDNVGLTQHIVAMLKKLNLNTPLLVTSSTQADSDNPYGNSKQEAEQAVISWSKETGSPAYILRLPGVFGKWSKPNYNSVVATFCYNISHDLPVEVSDSKHIVTLAYIDTVIERFMDIMDNGAKVSASGNCDFEPTFQVSLGDLKDRILAIHDIRDSLIIPNLKDDLNKYLYATYISYFDTDTFSYELKKNEDNRGWLAEFVKSHYFGQIFISKTKPGISRGDHWHHTKIEKFLVVEGQGEISFRNKIDSQEIISYPVDGDTPTVLDIPTGYVHAIKNTGTTDLVTIFWANEILNKYRPDTYYEKVELEK